ncbi:NACHT domain-containing protein [Streptomyces mirabilis]|uniref:NACHT domain-containing protein n=1 Tax=Streptomyces mirabilis TaxID=68239 RepID=UPI0036A116DF
MTASESGGPAQGWVFGNTFYGPTAINLGAGGVQNNYFQLVIDDPQEAAARDLARTVLAQWREEARMRGLFDPVPIPVPWRAVRDTEFGDHPHLIGDSAEGNGADPGAFSKAFLALRQRRLVVLGEAGVGKTTLAVLLVIELLQGMRVGDAVPVLLPMASWRPGEEHLHTWLEHRLLRDYPQLTAETARDLVRDRRILPVLDGLDELPPDHASLALKSLNEALAAGGSLILTCRTSAYAKAARTASVLRSAAVVRADPLSAEAAAEYLRSSATPQHAARWQPVLDDLARRPHGSLARCLSMPLMLWLARVAYQEPDTRPAELTDPARFPTAAAVERHLLDALVPAVYPNGPTPPPPRGRRPPRNWRADAANRWLATLARHLTDLNGEDISWWELRRRPKHWRERRVLGLLALVIVWMVVPIVDGQDFTLDDGMGGPVFFLYVGCLFLSFTMRVPDGLARGKVRFRPHLGLLLRLTVFPVGWVMVLFVGLSATAFDGPNSSLVLQILLLLGGLAAAVLALLLLAWLMVTAGSRVDRDEASTPHRSLTVSRRRTLVTVTGLAVVIVFFITEPALTTMSAADPTEAAPAFRLAALAAAFTVPAALTQSPWADYLLARSLLAARGLLPWRLEAFLADAHRRGVLRQVGSVYQFRHARLRDRLAWRKGAPAPEDGRGQDLLIHADIDSAKARSGTVKKISFDTAIRCETCDGSGTVTSTACDKCTGQGRVRTRRTLSVRIPPGVRDGTRIRLTGQGQTGLRGGAPGDLYVQLRLLGQRS